MFDMFSRSAGGFGATAHTVLPATKSLARLLPTVAAGLFWALVCFHSGQAQTTFGSITGVVTDPSGAAVPSAQITAVNQDTGFTRRQTTAVTGVFTVPDLVPGTYRVRVEAKGFNTQEKEGVLLDANHVVTVDCKRLPLGLPSRKSRYRARFQSLPPKPVPQVT